MSEKGEFLEHARWIKKKTFNNLMIDEFAMVECSNCETLFKAAWSKINYCPVCGAKMDEVGTSTPLDFDGDEWKSYEESGTIESYLCSFCGSRHAHECDCPECGGTLRPINKE